MAKTEKPLIDALQVETLCTDTGMHWRRVSPDEFEADGTRGCLTLHVHEAQKAGARQLTVALDLRRHSDDESAFVGTTRVPLEEAGKLPDMLSKAIDHVSRAAKDIIKAAQR